MTIGVRKSFHVNLLLPKGMTHKAMRYIIRDAMYRHACVTGIFNPDIYRINVTTLHRVPRKPKRKIK